MTVRRAGPEDAAELTRLRGLMFESWGGDTSDPHWRQASDELFRRRLRDDPEFAAFVVEGPDGGLVSSGVGWVDHHLAGPKHYTGLRGHVASMSTDAAHRGQGHARAVFTALMAWFGEIGITRVDLFATPAGEPLYRSFGFIDAQAKPLFWGATTQMDLRRTPGE